MTACDSRPIRLARLLPTAALVLALAGACAGQSQERYTANIAVFGTVVEITLREIEAERAEKAVGEITREFQTMHRQWHPWNPGPLVEINRSLARGEPAEVPESLAPLIVESRELYRQSDGLFNPAIGGLLELWGFQSSTLPEGPPPSEAEIAEWVEHAPSMDDLRLEGRTLHTTNPAVQLDFGGYAKGYAIERAIDILAEHGIDNGIVNAGGDLAVIGTAGGRPWRTGIRHPEGDRGQLLASLAVHSGEGVFTSGNYERFRADEDVRYSHILDPRTGWPVDGITSVTVVHDNAGLADAAATALVVAGTEQWQRIAAQMGIDHVMLVDDDGTVWMTPEMEQRVDFERQPESIRIRRTEIGSPDHPDNLSNDEKSS